MTTSGSYAYNPSIGEIVLYAFNLIGLRSTAITQEHMNSAKQAMNMLLSSWANRGVNLWKVDLVSVPLVAGQSTYTVEDRTIMVLDAYVSTPESSGSGAFTDRIISPISRSEWATYPNKTQQGFPTVFWFDRLIAPTITIWPVPDGSGAPTNLNYYRVKQIEDAGLPGGETADIPYRWMDAFSSGLGYYLARLWAPERKADMKADAEEAYMIAAAQDVENVQFYISPMIGGYFR
jgi:hypothetical protein